MSANLQSNGGPSTTPPSPQAVAPHDAASSGNPPTTPPHTSPNTDPAPTPSKLLDRPGLRSNASHVDVDFFDPGGVRKLRRTLTAMSAVGEQGPGKVKPEEVAHTESATSDDTVMTDGPFNFEKTLKSLVKKKEEAGVLTRELGVQWEDLRVVGLGTTASYQPTVGSLFDPRSIIEKIQTLRNPPVRDIISGFEGVVRPGEMLLVLGRPGSGCTTFLKTLANHRDEFYSVKGDVHYDSFTPEDIAKHYRGDVQYCPEDDVHFPTLTVKQTLDFAAGTRVPHVRTLPSRSQYVNMITEILSTIFGLKHVQHTPVGDAAIRGVSGGEKKRVSIAEALATRSRVHSWDNSTRGLDSSTALEFARALRIATDIDHRATIVSIYQAGETLYQLFDKVCLIYEGRMVYFGPADQARQYFIDMGYEPANRQTTPDFLVAVTDPNGRNPRPDFGPMPRTASEFADYFMRSPIAQMNKEDIAQYKKDFVGVPQRAIVYKESAKAEHAKTARKKSPYTISIPMQARAVMKRRVQILMGNKTATLFGLFSFIFQGVIIGTVFARIPDATSAYFSRGGVLFFTLLFSALSSMAEIPALFGQRPIVNRHQKAAMYHPFTEGLALTLVDIPILFTNTIIFGILIYFIVGLQTKSAGQFFIFYLFLFSMTIVMKAWFRSIAAGFKSEATAQAFSGIILLAMVIYTGYTIPKPSMIGALRWISYINPLRYGFEGVLVNEFHTLDGICSSLIPRGPGYEGVRLENQVCTTVGSLPGRGRVDGNRFVELSYGFSYAYLWRDFGIVVAFGIGFITALLIFTELNTSLAGESFVVLFKRGAKSPVLAEAEKENLRSDEERSSTSSQPTMMAEHDNEVAEKAIAEATTAKTDTFSWLHLQYTVSVPGGQRKLLDDVSGYVVPGKLTALMGESGAGKTTLLNVLAERVDVGVITGDRFVNGRPPPPDFHSQTGYCSQMDTHVPTDTVREALMFSASLRQPTSVPAAEKAEYVEECLKMCGLEAFAEATIGSLGVEHRKRTTIGVELAAKPRLLLFLDEPTSGLDSQSAWAIIMFLRKLADNGQAILCTIHQPSAELFQAFDRLLLLRKGGQTVYFGDLGHNATTLISYFERNGSRRCEPDENPAEFMLDVIGAGATATSDRDWHGIWKNSSEAEKTQRDLETIHVEGRRRPPVKATFRTQFATPWYHQLKELVFRGFRAYWRDPTYIMAKTVLNIFAGLFIGFTFFKSKNTQQGTQNQLFAVYMATVLAAPLSNQLQVPFLKARSIYEIRERPSRIYSWTAWVTSQYLAEIPWNIVGSTIFFLCWYWTVGFDSSRAGYTYLMYGVTFPLYYTSFAMAVAAMAPSAEIAALLFSVLFSFVFTFNGVLQPFRELGWWRWMYHLSPFTYLIDGLLGQALGRKPITCSSVELVTLNPPLGQTCQSYLQTYLKNYGGYVTNPTSTTDCHVCAYATTDQYLGSNFNIFYNHHWRNFGIMIGYIFFNIAAIYFFTYLFRIKRGNLFRSMRSHFARKRS
ncbi:putative ABC transporter superfamily, ABCG family. PDR (TC 3.A.1.205) subfamily protein [Lyophyllum shimeji]|uniref:ABC transporter superfamily, ABCG family. PDR (TC 3.A.1.205) subfamily protein n=1 Tax=Lyophyllum shimeji TaxID=47721 RepID=A0A9P3PUU4_LYOSH|nr:putative ABC transporter superfamily, ABCG family. PDR (TC 3.A.1.205) subfamily protein [Lyophyllum shimeji]